ncbi:MAG TPA: type IV pilus modification protein PilV [Rhodanobacteraceae bacterium]|nr:type IV pilus modification protein PilV [Rhodanobacteraceae bacterium]
MDERTRMYPTMRSRGFTLLEVLVAVLIFSLGLVGLAGLMVISVKTNQSAYLRTQAGFVAQSIADRIRLNRAAGPQNYNGTYSQATVAGDPCAGASPCTPAAVVTRDTRYVWSNQIASLPNASGTVNCVGALRDPTLIASPFTGQCTVTITWDEASLGKGTLATPGSNSPTAQTFAWVFQP